MAEPFWLTWWVWLAAALALAILEVALPGFIFLGFAIGAAITGLLLLIPGLVPSLPVLLLIFAVLSLVRWCCGELVGSASDGDSVSQCRQPRVGPGSTRGRRE